MAEAVRVAVLVKPRSSRSEVIGVRDGVLEVRIAAPPVEGEANRELIATVARYFGLPKSSVSILAGASGRRKWVALRGIESSRIAAVFGGTASR